MATASPVVAPSSPASAPSQPSPMPASNAGADVPASGTGGHQAAADHTAGNANVSGGVSGTTPAPAGQRPNGGVNAGAANFVSPSLYVGDLHQDVTEAMLFEVFNSVGPVTSIRVCRDTVTRRSLGYAYVNYQGIQDAERSLDTLNYTVIKGQPCRIMWCHRDPSLRKSGNGNIFVKNLDKNIDNKALYDTFSLFGNILSCKVAVDDNGHSKGYGFVHYENEESARSAIDKVNGMLIGGKTVYVGPFIRRAERDNLAEAKYTNVYIKNMPSAWEDESRLRETFSKFGSITSLVVRKDPKGRLFAFCNFADHDSAKAAVEALNGKRVTDAGAIKEGEDSGAEEEKEEEGQKREGDQILFVGPHQSKAHRSAMLRAKFEQMNQDRNDRFQGVNLYIKNMDDSIDDEKLRQLFEPFGSITSAKVMRDERGVSRCFGFVCFMSPEEATKAVTEMHLKLVKGKPLYVGLAERREQRLMRLQQRFRLPSLRPAAAALPGNVAAAAAAAQLQYGGGAPQLQGFAAGPGAMYAPRPLMGFSPHPHQVTAPMLPWRQQQAAAAGAQFASQGVPMRPQLGPLQHLYGQTNAAAAAVAAGMHAAAAGGPPMQMLQQQQRGGHRGGMGRQGGAGPVLNGNKQHMIGPKPGAGQQQPQGGPGSFKFTPQVRNQRLDQQMQPPASVPAPHNHHQVMMEQSQQLLMNPDAPLTAAALAAAQPSMQKQMLGEKLFPLIARYQPELAGKITGMMLEMDNAELLILLESEAQLKAKVDEALRVLQQAS
ncbi:putative polyadenylate binding protein [Toxoplasma gondii MAS]|uniref:Polyadenylate-binding protein n=1 Tax=Toxoplasma gondii MAS TaxID=943118 RepID=A0A086QMQ0_TOXGO|nr:putative polyadenylate binding protein [Toxoplasma gondii MAS]